MIVLGIDGMDPSLTLKFAREGLMPNALRLMKTGGFSQLGSSDPPQSPVAWSNFISGTNPGGHGIFDFIARDAATLKPYLSTSRMEGDPKTVDIGKWKIPIGGQEMVNQRKGPVFWNSLKNHGVDCRIIKIPSNFPPNDTSATTLSGLGTPDVRGSYGIFSFFTNDPKQFTHDVSGGHIQKIHISDNTANCTLPGPDNSFSRKKESADVPFKVYIDPSSRTAKIHIQESKLILKEGEWSRWVPVKFRMLPPLVTASGCCRFYLKKAGKRFDLYASPVNIDPDDPYMPISTPGSYSRRLARTIGRFYTQGMPEDTSALSAGVLNDAEYRNQAMYVLKEREKMLEYEFNRYNGGFLFFYFSSIDLNSHAFWRTIDRSHPMYNSDVARQHGDFIPFLYRQMDKVIGQTMSFLNEKTDLLVMSDHGFGPFRRKFHLNSWLMDNNYASPAAGTSQGSAGYFADTDWKRTAAYGLGLNGLYLNIKGREPEGIVDPSNKNLLLNKLKKHLESVKDPQTGKRVISRACIPEQIYSGPHTTDAPDLLVCYNHGYRASWDTIIGKYPRKQIEDNKDPWSGDHAIDSTLIPGTLIASTKIKAQKPSLSDLAPSILKRFGAPVPKAMTGKNIFQEKER